MRDHTLTRRAWQGFGTTNAVTAEWPLWEEWTVEGTDEFAGLGEFVRTLPDDVYVPSGLSLVLKETASVMTPELDTGVGDVTFWYRAATATNKTGGTIWVETSEDGETWTVRGSVEVGAKDTEWQSFSVYLNEPGARYLRLRSEAQATGLLRIDDVRVEASVTESRMQYWEDWTEPNWQAYHGTYNLAGWSLTGQIATNKSGLCAKLGQGDSIVSPLYPEGGAGNVVMVISGSTSIKQAVQVWVSTNRQDWVEVGEPLGVGNTRTNLSVGVPGVAAVKLEAVCDETESFTVDNIEVRIFEGSAASRQQPFETWSTGGYNAKSGQGWSCNNGYVENKEGSKVLRLGKVTGDYLMTPKLEGIGVFSFDVAAYSSANAPKFDVQISEDGKTWKTLKSYAIDSSATTLTTYSLSVQHEGAAYMRVAMTIAKLAIFDNFNAGEFKKPGSVALVPGITPDPPSLESNFRFTGDVMPVGQSTIEDVKMLYQKRLPPGQLSFGATNSVTLTYDPELGMYASGGMPPEQINTIMRYWLQVRWSTMEGSSVVTTTSLSETNETAFSEVTGGRVWINEIAYLATTNDPGDPDDFWGQPVQKHEFIELCGPAGTDIGGWKVALMLTRTVEVEKAGKQTYAIYSIPTNTTLPADVTVTNESTGKTMSYGFYVLGDKGTTNNPLPNVDQAFASAYVPTNINAYAASEDDHIHHQGMIQLKTKYGAVVDSLVYGGYFQGQNAGSQDSSGAGSLGATSSGSEASDFDWDTGSVTAGALNDGQELEVRESIDPEVPESLFHQAGLLVKGGLEDFHMIDSRSSGNTLWPADMRRDVRFYVGAPAEVIPVGSSGVLYVRHGTTGD